MLDPFAHHKQHGRIFRNNTKIVLPCVFAYLPPFTLEMVDFTYWTVLILIFDCVGWGGEEVSSHILSITMVLSQRLSENVTEYAIS